MSRSNITIFFTLHQAVSSTSVFENLSQNMRQGKAFGHVH